MSRRELRGALVALAAGAAVAALVIGIAGPGILWNDECDYACAARELARGKPPLCFDLFTDHVRTLGFPYLETHTRAAVVPIALAFRLLGPREPVAILPALAAMLASVTAAWLVARGAGGEPPAARGLAALVACAPTVAGFAGTAFLEPEITFAYLLAAGALVAPGRTSRLLLVAVGTAIGCTFRETTIFLAPAVAAGLFLRERTRGAPARRALVEALAVLAAGLAAGGAVTAVNGVWFRGDRRPFWAWLVVQPLLDDRAYREGYGAATNEPPPAITLALIAARAWKQAPNLFWSWDDVEGIGPSLVFVHAAALGSALVAARSRSGELRGLALAGLGLYAADMGGMLFFHEVPRLNARHLAAESALLLVAAAGGASELAAGRRRALLAALAAVVAAALLAIDVDVAAARARGRRTFERYTGALERLAAPEPGHVLVAYNGCRLPWVRPGVFVACPPATEATLRWLEQKLPISALVLDVAEPLVSDALRRTGRAPRRLGSFELAATDRSLGVTLLVYEKAR